MLVVRCEGWPDDGWRVYAEIEDGDSVSYVTVTGWPERWREPGDPPVSSSGPSRKVKSSAFWSPMGPAASASYFRTAINEMGVGG